MSEDDIFQTTKFVIQALDALKNEYEKILENLVQSAKILSSNKIEEKINLLRNSMNMIDLGIDEAHVMIQLDNYLQNVDGEKHKLRIQVKRLSQENTWLRNELGSTQKKLHESEQINACHSIEIENLKFLKDIQRYNNDNSTSQENHEHDLINDLFSSDDTDDEKDNQPNHSKNNIGSNDDLSMVKSQSTNNSTKDYEIPARLNTLHNLVLQYTSQGRYEVAVALCRQALDDLEKTLGHQHPDVATMLNILALVYRDQSEFKKAISLLYETLS
ncbi:unnamed protein product, partial [Rotaria magnacalcarata]